jgi:para-aminobenzoate synthetase component 1
MELSEFVDTMNRWGHAKFPFLFIVDFEMLKPVIFRLSEINGNEIRYDINGFTNVRQQKIKSNINLKKAPAPLSAYEKKFNKVLEYLEYGDTFLTNLTVATEVKLDHSLEHIFFQSEAKYKLLFRDEFLVFSPETFVQIKDGKIYAYPMKGTIDSSLETAREIILADKKELAEHVTIVDLIRNDLSQVATNVTVTRFRYIDEVKTASKNLFQVSSEVCGTLDSDYMNQLGDILLKLLPAGSVSGAPKPRTLEIIREVEEERRGYYTGVFGYFDGSVLDSGVMIRFIENTGGKFFYRSGGGITTQSVVESEYQEVIDKVYVPVA